MHGNNQEKDVREKWEIQKADKIERQANMGERCMNVHITCDGLKDGKMFRNMEGRMCARARARERARESDRESENESER